MFIVALLFSFFITLNASEDGVVNVDGFLQIIGEHFKGNYGYRANMLPIDHYEKDILVTYLPNGNGDCRFQLVHDPEHILMKNYNEFDPPEEKTSGFIDMYRLRGGSRNVAACAIGGKVLFCFKEWPEAPGVEIAARQFFEAFVPSEDVPLPKSMVIVINDKVFSVSEFIEGMPLRDFLTLRQSQPEQYVIDRESFQRTVVFCMIANPEDARLANCLARKKLNGKWEIVLIDNERSLGKEVVAGEVTSRVHCVPFCFYDLLQEPPVIEHTLYEMVDSVRMSDRLFQLLNEHKYHLALRQKLPDANRDKIILGIPLGEAFVENLTRKWGEITEKIISEQKSLAVIFREVMPDIAEIYLTDPIRDDVLKQIEKVDPGRNSRGTPPSAYVSLRHYFFSDAPPSIDTLLALFENILRKYGPRIDPRTIEEVKGLMATLARQYAVVR